MPEVVTNSLIVSATPRYYDEIMQVIQDLDFRPPMVMVQVLIAEVRLDDVFEFGVEMGLQDSLLYDRGITSTASPSSNPGFNFVNQSPSSPGLPNVNSLDPGTVAGQAISMLDVGRTSASWGTAGWCSPPPAIRSTCCCGRCSRTAGPKSSVVRKSWR